MDGSRLDSPWVLALGLAGWPSDSFARFWSPRWANPANDVGDCRSAADGPSGFSRKVGDSKAHDTHENGGDQQNGAINQRPAFAREMAIAIKISNVKQLGQKEPDSTE